MQDFVHQQLVPSGELSGTGEWAIGAITDYHRHPFSPSLLRIREQVQATGHRPCSDGLCSYMTVLGCLSRSGGARCLHPGCDVEA